MFFVKDALNIANKLIRNVTTPTILCYQLNISQCFGAASFTGGFEHRWNPLNPVSFMKGWVYCHFISDFVGEKFVNDNWKSKKLVQLVGFY
jgi:hypothetical protein